MIIISLLDNDFYKFTMMQAVLHQFPDVDVEYSFLCRTPNVNFSGILTDIEKELESLCSLKFSKDELDYLRTIPFFKKDFIDFLSLMKLNRDHVFPEIAPDGSLSIKVRGSWLLTILFEVPLLAIVNEIYFRKMVPNPDYEGARSLLDKKIEIIKKNREDFRFADFGTRRRHSFRWHDEVIQRLKENLTPGNFIGTSNVFFAKKYGLKPIGTMAHEWIMAGQAVGVKLHLSQRHMLQKWTDEYRGDLGIALSDTISVDAFLRDFDLYFAKLYDGVRHDSGDPIDFGYKIINHYKSLGINPMTKTIIFSNSLDFNRAEMLLNEFKGKINVSFGIGTNLTNDFPGVQPLSIVIKMSRCNGYPVAKISDDPEKTMCDDPEFLDYLKKVFNLK
ncbi:MAG: Nicotinate phosphoribosyltransferase 2 [Spirochaetes bacterium ADurb.Bin218]|nr:MAG: Nicotinate phosphoribosyltransferase 2 [Spirochaetes bacterium ADurb.Bin218]